MNDSLSLFTQILPTNTSCEESGAEGVIDVFSALGGADMTGYQYFCDGQNCDQCHPNDDGYAHMAEAVYAGLGFA